MHCIAILARTSVAWLTVALLGACAAIAPGQSSLDAAHVIAASGGLTPTWETAGGFRLLTYARGLEQGSGAVNVYIEGDGRLWRGRRPPADPTSSSPMGLKLAAQDPAPAVIWIGRPCMYLDDARACGARWWTSHRYAPEVVDALLEIVQRRVGVDRTVTLLGHSGGGVLATLMAARALEAGRLSVEALITVGAPLDLEGWTTLFRVTPLSGSLDPMHIASRLADLPQRHLVGARDEVVPVAVVQRFVQALPAPNRARLEVYPRYAHSCCWDEDWRMLCQVPAPGRTTPVN